MVAPAAGAAFAGGITAAEALVGIGFVKKSRRSPS